MTRSLHLGLALQKGLRRDLYSWYHMNFLFSAIHGALVLTALMSGISSCQTGCKGGSMVEWACMPAA